VGLRSPQHSFRARHLPSCHLSDAVS
jgi:hypothetical protein